MAGDVRLGDVVEPPGAEGSEKARDDLRVIVCRVKAGPGANARATQIGERTRDTGSGRGDRIWRAHLQACTGARPARSGTLDTSGIRGPVPASTGPHSPSPEKMSAFGRPPPRVARNLNCAMLTSCASSITTASKTEVGRWFALRPAPERLRTPSPIPGRADRRARAHRWTTARLAAPSEGGCGDRAAGRPDTPPTCRAARHRRRDPIRCGGRRSRTRGRRLPWKRHAEAHLRRRARQASVVRSARGAAERQGHSSSGLRCVQAAVVRWLHVAIAFDQQTPAFDALLLGLDRHQQHRRSVGPSAVGCGPGRDTQREVERLESAFLLVRLRPAADLLEFGGCGLQLRVSRICRGERPAPMLTAAWQLLSLVRQRGQAVPSLS